MAVDQDWPSVYPVAAPFKPSAVPLPVRMGYPVKRGVPMAKEGNLELLKVRQIADSLTQTYIEINADLLPISTLLCFNVQCIAAYCILIKIV